MASELEQFRTALNRQRIESRNGYCHFGHIDAALHQVTHPSGTPTAEYPRMMFLRGDPQQYRIVANQEEEA
jgi:hypothetical protein